MPVEKLWTINQLAEASGIERRLIAERLRGVKPAGLARKNTPGWRLQDALRPLVAASELQRERTRVAKVAADKAELEFRRLNGELLVAAEVQRADEAVWSALRDSVLALPDGLAQQLCDVAQAKGPAGVAVFLREQLKMLLMDASNAEFEYADQG